MKYYLLAYTLMLSILASSLNGQTSTRPQLWVEAASSFGFLDIAPFKLGFGGSAQLSLEKPINTKSSLGLQVGFSKMGNYNRVYGENTYSILPSGYQYAEQNNKLLAIGFLDLGLHFKHRQQEASRWSWSIGVNASLLLLPIGQHFEHFYFSVGEPEIGENSFVPGLISGESTTDIPLNIEDFARYDLSVEATLFYEITKGCALKASFRQGTRNLIKPTIAPRGDAQHYLSMVGVGFSVRLR